MRIVLNWRTVCLAVVGGQVNPVRTLDTTTTCIRRVRRPHNDDKDHTTLQCHSCSTARLAGDHHLHKSATTCCFPRQRHVYSLLPPRCSACRLVSSWHSLRRSRRPGSSSHRQRGWNWLRIGQNRRHSAQGWYDPVVPHLCSYQSALWCQWRSLSTYETRAVWSSTMWKGSLGPSAVRLISMTMSMHVWHMTPSITRSLSNPGCWQCRPEVKLALVSRFGML